uniref:BOP1 N-terminal domain-containing protein n=1 Tax=Panagrolaimus sp. JU765 TaxID=591449 RepID=A0AC34QZX0_9BILA
MGKRKVETKPLSSKDDVDLSLLKGPPAVGEDDRFDSSDEEDLRNTIGNVPLEWYDEYEHIGYDLEGKKIAKKAEKKGEIDTFLDRMEDPNYWRKVFDRQTDPNYWRKVFDRQTGEEVTLTDEQVAKLRALATNAYPDIGYNPYEPFLDIFSSDQTIHPIDNRPPHKRSFIPSALERAKVSKMVHAIKMGWRAKVSKMVHAIKMGWVRKQQKEEAKMYDPWEGEDYEPKSRRELLRLRLHLPAPKVALPGHVESYNPPPEYLFTDAEKAKWENLEPEDRKLDFIPRKYDALRKVPFYEKFFNDRYDRCLDLYMAPRIRKNRLNIDPSQLLPELPDPRDLMPFPTTLAFFIRAHKGQVRSISIEPENGELLVSGGEDGFVCVWYLNTGRCLKKFNIGAPVTCVAFNPNPKYTLVAVAAESNVVTILNTECGDKLKNSETKKYLEKLELQKSGEIDWKFNKKEGRVELTMDDKIRQVVWHKKGDYFATVGFEYTNSTVHINQLSTSTSQKPFTKKKGHIQAVQFHPSKALFFVGTREHVRVYDLLNCTLVKKLTVGTKWLGCMQLEAHGDNLFIGGLDNKFSWMDLDFSNMPWKTFQHHSSAIRSVCHSVKHPLLASVGDDGQAVIYHTRIPQDVVAENEVIPVKRLFGHSKNVDTGLTILTCSWHATQPWLLTGGADGLIAVFTY